MDSANRFVAGFVGSHAINFLKTTAVDAANGVAKTEDGVSFPCKATRPASP